MNALSGTFFKDATKTKSALATLRQSRAATALRAKAKSASSVVAVRWDRTRVKLSAEPCRIRHGIVVLA